MHRRYSGLERELNHCNDETKLLELKDYRSQLEEDDEPVKTIVNIMAHNGQLKADGCDPDHFVDLSMPQRWLAHLIDLNAENALKRLNKSDESPVAG
jgi:hypothetical protein